MQMLQPLFRLPQVARVSYGVAIAIGEKVFQAHVNTSLLAGRNVFNSSLCINGKLAIVAIGPLEETNALDLFCGKFFNPLVLVSNEPEPAYATAIGEDEVFAVQLPACLFVLYTPVIVLEFGIAFLPWFVGLAVVIETGDSGPGAFRRRLTSLRIEFGGKGKLFGKLRTSHIEIRATRAACVHPEAQGFVTDELNNAYRRVYCGILLFVAS